MSLVDEYKGWKEWWVRPLGKDGDAYLEGMPDIVLAPNIDWAFKSARLRAPSWDAWEVMGHPDPKDREVCNYFDKRHIQTLVKIEIEHD